LQHLQKGIVERMVGVLVIMWIDGGFTLALFQEWG
jgi:hypothetical protein